MKNTLFVILAFTFYTSFGQKRVAATNAVKAAKEKAEYLLEAVGNSINETLEIIEQQDSGPDFNYYRGNVFYKNKEEIETISSSEFKKIVISFSYKVKYSIK